MTVTLANVNYMWTQVIMPRVGNVYVFGGSLSPNAVRQGTDCSGACSEANEAVLYGPQMNWVRQFWTGTFAGANPGDHGPFGGVPSTADWVCTDSPGNIPPGTVMTFAVLQLSNPSQAHMVCCCLDPDNVTGFGGPGVYVGIESGGSFTDGNGNSTLHIGPVSTGVNDPEFNQWFYLNQTISGSVVVSPPQPGDQYLLPIIAEGERLGVSPTGITMAICCVFDEAGNPPRMWANSKVPESLVLPHDAVGNNGMSCGLFQQQAQFGWGTVQQEMDPTQSATMFYQHLLNIPAPGYDSGAKPPWQYIEEVQGSATADGSNYELQWPAAQAAYARLTTTSGSWLDMATPDQLNTLLQQVGDLHGAAFNSIHSDSAYRHLDESLDMLEQHEMVINDDGMTHPQWVEWSAARGHPGNLAILAEVASGSPSLYPDRADDITMAKASWAIVQGGALPPVAPTPGPLGPTPGPAPVTPVPAPVVAITAVQLLGWAKDMVVVLGALGTWATTASGWIGQLMPTAATTPVPLAIAGATGAFAMHTVHQKRVAQKLATKV